MSWYEAILRNKVPNVIFLSVKQQLKTLKNSFIIPRISSEKISKIRTSSRQDGPVDGETCTAEDEVHIRTILEVKKSGEILFEGSSWRPRQLRLYRQILQGRQRLIFLKKCCHFETAPIAHSLAYYTPVVACFRRPPPPHQLLPQRRESGQLAIFPFPENILGQNFSFKSFGIF